MLGFSAVCSALLAFMIELQCSCAFAATGFVTSPYYFSTIATLSDVGDVYLNHNLHLSQNILLIWIVLWFVSLQVFLASKLPSTKESTHQVWRLVNSLDETKLLLSREWLGCLLVEQKEEIHFSSLHTLNNHVPGNLAIWLNKVQGPKYQSWSFYTPFIFWNSETFSEMEVAM